MPRIGELQHSSLGRVLVSTRPNTRRASARWRNGMVSLSVPQSLGLPDINRILDSFAPRLLKCRPQLRYTAPMHILLPGVEFIISRQSILPGKILCKASLPVCSLEVADDIDLDSDEATRTVSNLLCGLARRIAGELILPRARTLAAQVGRTPTGWSISTGFRTLGTCSSSGIISLSYALVFLPAELRDYIILHELAHLSELNHSPRFHALLAEYLPEPESTLAARLRAYAWPILRK